MKITMQKLALVTFLALSAGLAAQICLAQTGNMPPDPSAAEYRKNYPLGQGLVPADNPDSPYNIANQQKNGKKQKGMKGFFQKVKDYCTPPDTNPLLQAGQGAPSLQNAPLPTYVPNEPGLNTPQPPNSPTRATVYAPVGGGSQMVVGPNGEVSTMIPTGKGGYNVFGVNNSSFSSLQPNAQGGYSVFGTNGQFSQMTPSTGGGYNIWNQNGEQGTLQANPGGGYNVTGTDGSFNTIMPMQGAPNIFQVPSSPSGH